MNFVNNYSASIVLPLAANSVALALPNGSYRLTLADSASAPTRWEIVDAVVAAGTATLTRAREGTTRQDWPSGSVIYNALTASQLSSIFDLLESLAARVAALEGGSGTPDNALTDEAGNMLVDGAGNQLIGV